MTRDNSQEILDAGRVRELLPEIAGISDETLRTAVEQIWARFWVESQWEDLADVPKNLTTAGQVQKTPDALTLVTHTRAVAQMASAAAETIEKLHGIPVDRDRLLAIALLHDASKAVEYEPRGDSSARSRIGQRIQHGVYGAFLAWQYELPLDIVHGIISHTPSSRTIPQTQEALIVRYVDFLDTDSILLDLGETLHLA